MQVEDRSETEKLVQSVLDKWTGYCDRNWLNDSGDLYSPEIKVKRLLDALAYYMLLGHTEGIETDYRRVMHAKREIPVSSCPSNIENLMYASGGGSDIIDRDEVERFNLMLERLDSRAQKYDTPRKPKVKIESGQHKRRRLGIQGGEWCRVDTENKFWFGNEQYVICDNEAQYAPVSTEYGDYYAMDKILASGGKFYDMNYNEVQVMKCGGIVPHDVILNWIEPLY